MPFSAASMNFLAMGEGETFSAIFVSGFERTQLAGESSRVSMEMSVRDRNTCAYKSYAATAFYRNTGRCCLLTEGWLLIEDSGKMEANVSERDNGYSDRYMLFAS